MRYTTIKHKERMKFIKLANFPVETGKYYLVKSDIGFIGIAKRSYNGWQLDEFGQKCKACLGSVQYICEIPEVPNDSCEEKEKLTQDCLVNLVLQAMREAIKEYGKQ